MACGKVVEAFYGMSFAKEMLAKVRSYESGAAGDKYVHIMILFIFSFFLQAGGLCPQWLYVDVEQVDLYFRHQGKRLGAVHAD